MDQRVLTSDRAYSHRLESETTVSGPSTNFPRRLFMASIAGGCKFPSGLVSDLSFARGFREVQYVLLMNYYLRGGEV